MTQSQARKLAREITGALAVNNGSQRWGVILPDGTFVTDASSSWAPSKTTSVWDLGARAPRGRAPPVHRQPRRRRAVRHHRARCPGAGGRCAVAACCRSALTRRDAPGPHGSADRAGAHGLCHDVRSIAGAEFAADPGEVTFHREHREAQLLADPLVRPAFRNEPDDHQFPVAQVIARNGIHRDCQPARCASQEAAGPGPESLDHRSQDCRSARSPGFSSHPARPRS